MRLQVASALAVLLACTPFFAQERFPIGSRVGSGVVNATPTPTDSQYDGVGRRDPFVSLMTPPKAAPVAPAARPRAGLGAVALADVAVTGIVHQGATTLAVLEGPGGKSFVARSRDRLQDATVKSIDANGVTFVQQIVDAAGATRPRDIRKALRQTALEEGR